MHQKSRGQAETVVLVTGGAGYIGSHTSLLLLERGYQVVVVDNCSNAQLNPQELDANGNLAQEFPESLRRIEKLTNKRLVAFYNFDLVDGALANSTNATTTTTTDNNQKITLDEIFQKHNIQAVIHFAALKSVSESIDLPLNYYTNNVVGTINLLNAMHRNSCRRLIFSSSATVYGMPKYNPIDERHQTGQNILNPYGRSKFMIEEILRDICAIPARDKEAWSVISLRYFNPVGCHPSGYIGEHALGIPNNLMPYLAQVSVGKRDKLYVFGDDFDTKDGTGVRDYIHIMDLASGHLNALDKLLKPVECCANNNNNHNNNNNMNGRNGAIKQLAQEGQNSESSSLRVYNLGTGTGYSVLEVIQTYERVNNIKIPYEITKRRQGDAGEVYADPSLAKRDLGWSADCSLADMVRDTHRWQSSHPDGYNTKSTLQD